MNILIQETICTLNSMTQECTVAIYIDVVVILFVFTKHIISQYTILLLNYILAQMASIGGPGRKPLLTRFCGLGFVP